ncbi:hypothetical protein DVH05_020281 [Phytophthora capsici]|nr:hypothetical protein DVH05_020281 [Phytophthora capsici]
MQRNRYRKTTKKDGKKKETKKKTTAIKKRKIQSSTSLSTKKKGSTPASTASIEDSCSSTSRDDVVVEHVELDVPALSNAQRPSAVEGVKQKSSGQSICEDENAGSALGGEVSTHREHSPCLCHDSPLVQSSQMIYMLVPLQIGASLPLCTAQQQSMMPASVVVAPGSLGGASQVQQLLLPVPQVHHNVASVQHAYVIPATSALPSAYFPLILWSSSR